MTVIPDGHKALFLRQSRDLSQKALAAAADLGESTIRNIESGKAIDSRSLAKLARFLQVDTTYLLLPPPEGTPNSPSLLPPAAPDGRFKRAVKKIWHDPVLASIIAACIVLLAGTTWKLLSSKWKTSHSLAQPSIPKGEELQRLLRSNPSALQDLLAASAPPYGKMLQISSPKSGTTDRIVSPLTVSGTIRSVDGYTLDAIDLTLLDTTNTELAVTTVASPQSEFQVPLVFERPHGTQGLLLVRGRGHRNTGHNEQFHFSSDISVYFLSGAPDPSQDEVKIVQVPPGIPPPMGNPYSFSWLLLSNWPRDHSTTEAVSAQHFFAETFPEGTRVPGGARLLLYALFKLGGRANTVGALVRQADKLYRQEFPFLYYQFAGYTTQRPRIANIPPIWFNGPPPPNAPPMDNLLRGSRLIDFPTGSESFLAQPIQFAEPYLSRLRKPTGSFAPQVPPALSERLLRTAAKVEVGLEGEARKELDAILHEYPNSFEAVMQSGALSMRQKCPTAAMAAFQKAHAVQPNELSALMSLVRVMIELKQGSHAIALLNGEISRRPNVWELRAFTADVFLRLANPGLAVAELEAGADAIQVTADKMKLLMKAASVASNSRDLPKAILLAEKARKADPNNIEVVMNLGRWYDESDRLAEACEVYKDALKLRPADPIMLNNYAYILAESSPLYSDQTLTYAERAFKAMPRDTVTDTLAWVYVKKGSPDKAIHLLETVVKNNPDNALFQYHLGVALAHKGNDSEARAHLSLALKNKSSQQRHVADINRLLKNIRQ